MCGCPEESFGWTGSSCRGLHGRRVARCVRSRHRCHGLDGCAHDGGPRARRAARARPGGLERLAGPSAGAKGQNSGDQRLLVEADELIYDNDRNTVTARGNAELHYGARTLQADGSATTGAPRGSSPRAMCA